MWCVVNLAWFINIMCMWRRHVKSETQLILVANRECVIKLHSLKYFWEKRLGADNLEILKSKMNVCADKDALLFRKNDTWNIFVWFMLRNKFWRLSTWIWIFWWFSGFSVILFIIIKTLRDFTMEFHISPQALLFDHSSEA